MTKTALRVLSIGLMGAILIGIRTIFLTPGSTLTTKSAPSGFQTQGIHFSAPSDKQGTYIPFDPTYGLQGRQWSAGKSESLVE